MEVEYRKAFYRGGMRLFSYPLKLEEEDYQQAIIEQLAYEYGCKIGDINVYLEECAPKEHDFSRDCAVEHMGKRNGQDCWRILNVANGTMYTHTGSLDVFIEEYERIAISTL